MRVMFLCLTVFTAAVATAQTAPDSAAIEELQNGKSLIETPVFTAEEDHILLTLFAPTEPGETISGSGSSWATRRTIPG